MVSQQHTRSTPYIGLLLLLTIFLTASTLAQPNEISFVKAAEGEAHVLSIPGKVAVEWHFYDEHRVWLSINSFSGHDWIKDGFNPSFTYIRSHYKPVIKQMPDGQWQISFTSEIAEGIP